MLLRDVPIRFLLVAGFLLSGLIPLMAMALMSLSIGREELTNQAFAQLESVRDIKKDQLENFFEARMRQTEVLAANPYVRATLHEFSSLIDGPGGIGRSGLAGHKDNRFDAPPEYRRIHDDHFPYFQKYAAGNEYHDVFLMDPSDGFTFFTVEKEADFGIPIAKVESSLRDVWSKASSGAGATVSDTRPYAPSGNAPAQFIAAPIKSGEDILGVVAVQISLDAIDELMGARSGMGKTDETYLVGADGRMRSDSYLDPVGRSVVASFAGTVEDNGARTEAVRYAFEGVTGARKLIDYNGNNVLSAYAPVSFGGVTWAIIAEIDEAEIDAKIGEALNGRITVVLSLSLALLLIMGLSISTLISKGIGRVKTELSVLMDGVLAGREDLRGDPSRVSHDFRGVVSKTNDLIDAFQQKTDEGRKLEEVIAYNQRMESIGTLAGGIAHDFNNILAYMLTYGDLVMDDLEEGTAAHQRMREILAGIDRAGELVAQIMTFGRQLKREKRPVEVAPLLKETSKLLKATIPKSITVTSRISSTGTTVMADPPQLHQIVMNLCTNAFHAMLDIGGEMIISLEERTLPGDGPADLKDGHYCVISVEDTGCGIEPEIMDRIFEPFFTTKPVGQGSGMGLAVVHGIVTAHEGAVILDSEPGHGTTARVYLPMRQEISAPEDGASRPRMVRGSGLVLFVDDEEPICASTALMMESLGYDVDSYTNPLEALEQFAKAPEAYAALVTDINMPDLSGVDLAQKALELRAGLPVLLVTGYNDLLMAGSESVPHAEVLLKPFKKSDFSALLASVIGRSSGEPDSGGA